jgi:acetyl esterase/lipase
MKLSLCLIMLFSISVTAAQEKAILLYPKGVVNSKKAPATYVEKTENERVSMVTDPTITPFLPARGKANGTAVIICPGGGYSRLAISHEGYQVAQKFADMGVTAFVLKYRLPSDQVMQDRSIGPLQDAQRAIQIVRQRAKEWSIDTAKVGIMGFSAGGHLAATAATHFNQIVIDNKDNVSVRPSFALLIYPVITFTELTHKGSKENLIGKDAPQDKVDLYSNEKQVTATTPPTFFVHAGDDRTVPVMNSIMMYEALLKNKVKTEMHIYQAGGHGFGLNNKTTKDYWFDRCTNWMAMNGF